MTRRILKLIYVVTLILAAACAGPTTTTNPPDSTGQTSDVTEVRASGFLFDPAEVTIEAGDAITWINDDKILHTITAGTPETPTTQFDRDLDGKATSTSIRFDQPGDYTYFCSRHPHMQGVVHVRADS